MTLFTHQQKIIDADPKKCGLFLGTGSGKTRIALMLASGTILVIAPKTQKEDMNWERESNRIWGDRFLTDFSLTVISKETFRRDHASLPRFDTVIIDEAHTCLGVTPNVRYRNKKPIPKTSQLFEAVQDYIKKHNPERLYLVTATIIKSPMTVWGAAKILGNNWDFYRFRDTFYTRLPVPGREIYVIRRDSDLKDKLAELVKKLGYTGRLSDYFDVPDQIYRTIHIELTAEQKKRIKDMRIEYPDPIVRCGKINQIENGVLAGNEYSSPEYFKDNKIEKLLELALEFPKMVVFARYTAQIKQIAQAMKDEGYNVFTMTGLTKDRGELIKKANESEAGIFICQAQISSGWELPSYDCMVFVSRTYSFVDYSQSLGRIQRVNNIKKNIYINLIVKGGVDEAVDKCLSNKQDFDERIYGI